MDQGAMQVAVKCARNKERAVRGILSLPFQEALAATSAAEVKQVTGTHLRDGKQLVADTQITLCTATVTKFAGHFIATTKLGHSEIPRIVAPHVPACALQHT